MKIPQLHATRAKAGDDEKRLLIRVENEEKLREISRVGKHATVSEFDRIGNVLLPAKLIF